MNPDIDAGSHPISLRACESTNSASRLQDARVIYRWSAGGVRRRGSSAFMFTRVADYDRRAAAPRRQDPRRVANDARRGFTPEHVDVGGGPASPTKGGRFAGPADYAEPVISELPAADSPCARARPVDRWPCLGLVARVVDTKRYRTDDSSPCSREGWGSDPSGPVRLVPQNCAGAASRAGADKAWDISVQFAREARVVRAGSPDAAARGRGSCGILDAGAMGR